MGYQTAQIKDKLMKLEKKVDKILEILEPKKDEIQAKELPDIKNVTINPDGSFQKMTENQIKMARVRAAKGRNTGEEGRG